MQFYEELVHGANSGVKELPKRPLNTKITFADSDSSSSDDEEDDEEKEEEVKEGDEEKGEKKHKTDVSNDDDASHDNGAEGKSNTPKIDDPHSEAEDNANDNKGDIENKADELPAMKQCCKTDVPTCDSKDKVEQISIDRLIEAELKELGDKNKVT